MSNITLYSLADYNNGVLVPHTFDLDEIDTKDEYYGAISKWLESVDKAKGTDIYIPKREEWIVCDYEDIPPRYVGEYDLDPEYWDYREAVDSSCLDESVFEAAAECEIEPEEVEEAYQGSYSSDEDFAYEFAESCGLINEDATWPNNYIDWEAAARDLMMDYESHNGHYFWRG